jgi:hypothetical protein
VEIPQEEENDGPPATPTDTTTDDPDAAVLHEEPVGESNDEEIAGAT